MEATSSTAGRRRDALTPAMRGWPSQCAMMKPACSCGAGRCRRLESAYRRVVGSRAAIQIVYGADRGERATLNRALSALVRGHFAAAWIGAAERRI